VNPLTLLKLAPWALVLLVGIFAGVERVQISNRDVTIAQKDTALKGMQAQQAENIAAAEKKVRDAMQADLDYSTKLVANYAGEIAELQEKQNAAEVSVAAVPVEPVAKGCPDPMSLPVLRAFTSGLPDR
jgi:hypothetical protein